MAVLCESADICVRLSMPFLCVCVCVHLDAGARRGYAVSCASSSFLVEWLFRARILCCVVAFIITFHSGVLYECLVVFRFVQVLLLSFRTLDTSFHVTVAKRYYPSKLPYGGMLTGMVVSTGATDPANSPRPIFVLHRCWGKRSSGGS